MPETENSVQQSAVENDIPVAMRKVYRRLQRWRDQRAGRERIPESLWAAAGELARQHGVNQVSRALRLEFNQLKRVSERGGAKGRKQSTPEFVELIAPYTSSGQGRAIEVEGPRGKLRIELNGTATAELIGISRAMWEMLA